MELEKIVENEELTNKIKRSFSAHISCIPWHFLAKKEYEPDPSFSKEAWENIVLPSLEVLK